MSLKALNSIGGFSVGNNQSVIYANGDIITGNANLGNAATANFFLGDGGLLSNLPSGNGLANGNSNVSVVANGNITMSVAGNSNVVIVTSTGINVNGSGNFTGSLSANNFTGNFSGTLSNGTSNVRIPTANGNVNISAGGNANIFVVRSNGIVANGSVVITDPIIEQGGFANGAPLTSDDGKDRGAAYNYYNGFSKLAFSGWDQSNLEFVLASEVTIANDVATIFGLGNVRAGYFLGNVLGNIEGNITAPGANTQVLFNDNDQVAASNAFTFNKTTNALTVTGEFSSGSINTLGNANVGNFFTAGNLEVLGLANVGEIYTGGNVNAVGNISGVNFQAGGNVSAVGNVSAGNISTTGNSNVTGTINAGNANLAGNLTAVGNVTVTGNSSFTNAARFTNRITVGNPNSFPKVDAFSNGYLQVYNLDVTPFGGNGNVNGNFTARQMNVSYATIGSLSINNDALVAGNVTVESLISNTTINAAGNLKAANANLGNLVTANFFSGDGYLLTNITVPAGSVIENGNSNVAVAPNANVTFRIAGVANVVTISNTQLLSELPIDANANITGQNLIANGAVYSDIVRDGNSVITINGASEYIQLGVNAASNVLFVNSSGIAVTGNANVSANVNISQKLNVTGNANVSNIGASGTIQANGNITSNANIIAVNANLGNLVTANFFAGDGYLLTNLTIAAGSAIVNGNSNVTVAPNANVSVSAGGTDNVTTFTSNSVVINQPLTVNTSANITGNVNVDLRVTTNTLTVQNGATFQSGLNAANNSTITAYGFEAQTRNGFPGFMSVSGNADIGSRLTVSGTANFFGAVNVQSLGANGTISANYLSVNYTSNTANLNVSNNASFNNVNVSGNFNGAALSLTGNIAAANANLGNLVTANFFSGDGYLLTNLTIPAGTALLNGNSNLFVLANGNITTSVAGNANVQVITGSGVNIAGYVNASGNGSFANLTAAGGNFSGNLSTSGSLSATGNLTANGSANITGNANIGGFANIGGNLTVSNGSANISGNLTAANANLGNYVYANFFEGDGSLLTNLTIVAGNALLNGNSNVYVEYSGNINFRANGVANAFVVSETGVSVLGNVSATGSVNAQSYANGTSNLIIRTNSDVTISAGGTANALRVTNLGVNVSGTLRALSNLSVTGNANTGNLGVGGIISAGGEISGGSLDTSGNLTVGGVANIQTISSPGTIFASGNITSGSTLAGALLSVTGNANVGNIGANFGVFNDNVTALNFKGIFSNGNSNINMPAANGNINFSAAGNSNVVVITGNGLTTNNLTVEGTLTGNFSLSPIGGNITNVNVIQANTFIGVFANGNSNVAIPAANGNVNISASGNSNVLVVTGTGVNVAGTSNTTGNISGAGNLNISGNAIIGGNLTVDGNLIYINVTDLSVEDPIIQLQTGPNATPPSSNTGKDVGTALNYYTTSAKVAWMGYDVSAQEITFGNDVTISSEVVSYNSYANIRAGNAQLGNLATANFVSGVLTTASQPNITSIGTLSSLVVSGNANVGGNVIANNFVAGTGSGGNLTGANIISANTGNFSAGLNVTGVSNLGPIGNVIITGGSNGQVLSTNGSGNLSWVTISSGSISNGNSNINIPTANGNITMAVSGNSNVVVVTGTGINVAGYSNITGNLNAGNVTVGIGSGGNLSGANVITANTFTGVFANGNSNVRIPTANGNVNISAVGNANVVVVTGTGINVAGTGNFTGNLNAPNVIIGAGLGGNLTGANFISANTANFSVALNVAGLSNLGPVGNVTITGGSSGQYLQTNGSGGLSWANASGGTSISNGNSNVNIPAANGNVNISVAGNTNVAVITGTGVNVTGTLNVTGNSNISNIGANIGIFTGNITAANASLGNLVTANFVTGTLTTAAQPNITSVGTLGSLTTTGNVSVGNNLSVTSNLSVTGRSNLGAVGNVIITGGTANYVLSTDGAGNLSWVAQSGGGGGNGTPGGSNTQIQFNDSGAFAGNAGLVFNKTNTTLTANNFVASSTANLGNVSNVTITGGTIGQVLSTNGSGGLSWSNVGTTITVDDFTGNGSQTAYTLTTVPASVDYTLVSIAGTFQPRNAYSIVGNVLTFTSAPPNTSPIEVTTFQAVTYAGPNTGSFVSRTYTANGVQNTFTVTNGVTANSVIVTENGIVQTPGTDYTVTGANLTFTTAPANTTSVVIREIPAATGGGSTYASASANLNASANTKYVLDTSSSNIVITLPAPSFGMEVGIIDGTGNANTNAITVFGNGANIQGSNSNMTVNTSRAAFTLVYYNSTQGWLLTNV